MNGEKVDIFGVKFDNLSIEQISLRLFERTGVSGEKPLILFTPNPEIVMAAQKDNELMNALSAADIVSADGIGIVWASKYFGMQIKKRASGYDIAEELFRLCSENGGRRAFFFGGSQASVEGAAKNMMAKYEQLDVCGVINGYFDSSENIIEAINEAAPDLLLVGLGAPKQEKWINKHAASLNAKAVLAVGGSFDVMSGNLKRAPVIFQRLGLEWLYRLIRQPKRIFRMVNLPLFVIKVLTERAWRKNA